MTELIHSPPDHSHPCTRIGSPFTAPENSSIPAASSNSDSSTSSSSSKTLIFSTDALSSVDWHATRRRFSDDEDDDVKFAGTLETTSGSGSSNLSKAHNAHRRGHSLNIADSSSVTTTKTTTKSSAAAATGNVKPAINHNRTTAKATLLPSGTAIAMNVYNYPAAVPAVQSGFSGPLRPNAAGKPPAAHRPTGKPPRKPPIAGTSEPTSPHVTCLGRVKIRDQSSKRNTARKQLVMETATACNIIKERRSEKGAGNFLSRKIKLSSSIISKADSTDAPASNTVQYIDLKLPFSCVAGGAGAATAPSRRPAAGFSAESTRRERAASLAESLTEFLNQNHTEFHNNNVNDQKNSSCNSDYVPSVPPPNSLLLMRTSKRYDNSAVPDFVINVKSAAGTSSSSASASSSNSIGRFSKLSSGPLSEIEGTIAAAMVIVDQADDLCSSSSSRDDPVKMNVMQTYASAASLWQRRALPELSAIEIRKPSI